MNFNRYANILVSDCWPGRKVLRRMGYLGDQQGIMNRYIRESKGWESHLENTKAFVIRCLEEAHPSAVTVLGSGWLLDFPVNEARELCPDLILADIFHPPQIVRKVKDMKGVELLLDDITGGMIRSVYDFVRQAKASGTKPSLATIPRIIPRKVEGRYYISLNVLNQLDILLIDYLNRFARFPEFEIDDLRHFIQNSHIGLLRGNGCLVTDVEEHHEAPDGTPAGNKNLLYTSLPLPPGREEWIWDFDESGYYHHDIITRLKVVALSC